VQYNNGTAYRYGFNDQEKSSEITSNTNTAEFWEYDSRIGRRWNRDPLSITGLSVYATFSNNPIELSDPLGDTTINGQKMEALNPAHPQTLQEVIVKSTPKLKVNPEAVVHTDLNCKCHITNEDVIQSWSDQYNAETKNLDRGNGQLFPPINPVVNLLIGSRVYNGPSPYTGMSSPTGFNVNANGYVDKDPRPFGGPVPLLGEANVPAPAFFSGAGTEAAAIDAGFGTLSQTRAGQNLMKLTEGMPYEPGSQAYEWWARLSARYANGIPEGSKINVFLNNPSATGIWNTVERPILEQRNITIQEILIKNWK